MKTSTLVIAFLLTFGVGLAQTDSSQYWHVAFSDPSVSYYDVVRRQQHWFNQVPDTTGESGSEQMFNR